MEKYDILKKMYSRDKILNRLYEGYNKSVNKLLNLFEEKGFITKKLTGRRNKVTLTEKGMELAACTYKIKTILERI